MTNSFGVAGLIVLSTSGLLAQVSGTFVPTGSTFTPRNGHTATLLNNGLVLIAGGVGAANSTEKYDPATGTFSGSGGMINSRFSHTATLLQDGRVLICGGYNPSGYLTSAELYDPSTEIFSAAGNMIVPRANHRATLLNDGRVLITGGRASNTGTIPMVMGELYDPATGAFLPAGKETVDFFAATATLLEDGRVFLFGGLRVPLWSQFADTFLFDPKSNGFDLGLTTGPFWSHTATALGNGKILIVGGNIFTGTQANDWGEETRQSADLFDISSRWYSERGLSTEARSDHTATMLPNGSVLIAGGWRWETTPALLVPWTYLTSAEMYDPNTRSFTFTGAMSAPRAGHTATLLPDGTVLMVGGREDSTAELYVPAKSDPQ